ncbi:hypothetical protein [Methylorubrum thiocyanatum]|uniref:hypothetical protein n=1 Tax=Methylorubrum TaxID=2282523 RepID=UPI00398C2663
MIDGLNRDLAGRPLDSLTRGTQDTEEASLQVVVPHQDMGRDGYGLIDSRMKDRRDGIDPSPLSRALILNVAWLNIGTHANAGSRERIAWAITRCVYPDGQRCPALPEQKSASHLWKGRQISAPDEKYPNPYK